MRGSPKVHVGYRLAPEVVQALDAEAVKRGRSKTLIVEDWLREAALKRGYEIKAEPERKP